MFDALMGEGLDDDDGTLGAVVQNFWLVAGKAIIKEEFLGEDKLKYVDKVESKLN